MQRPDRTTARVLDPLIKEHFDAYIILGYSAHDHARTVVAEFGRDPSCVDGLRFMHVAAERWQRGTLDPQSRNRPDSEGPDAPKSRSPK